MVTLKSVAFTSLPTAVAFSQLHNAIAVSVCLSIVAYYATYRFIPLVSKVFIKHGRCGKDRLKKDGPVIAESMGLIAGVVYLASMCMFIPVPFLPFFRVGAEPSASSNSAGAVIPLFPLDMLAQYLAALLSLFSMLFLGFVDDVVDIKWRVKIWMPLFACIPLLMVYFVTYGVTHVVVPIPFRGFWGLGHILDLGIFYYAYMAALCIFSTNAINIIAGLNGVEGIQCFIIGTALVINNICVVLTTPYPLNKDRHLFSMYFLLPFLGVTIGYLRHNWYPARCFGGDTYVYFAGMTFAVVGIMGVFTKTLLLFMFPQIFNFLYSCPQLFGFVECPRHRMPQLNEKTGLVEPTRVSLEKTRTPGLLMLRFLELFSLVDIERDPKTKSMLSCNNLTLINLLLVKWGPASEAQATVRVGLTQALFCLIGFGMRYGLAFLFYRQKEAGSGHVEL
ncbi:phospho-N-acetylmuramoyl-pentapeptide-transferase [Chytriomyces confervae]|uniref:UDP-N-acetylglucosamine--dolichyl-phosphate N-acetylglucosaminephosphotransferase n=1 Tax=Chytriomyces confervae TaxID=246404 RepID=A0A507FEP2_9FUNG|nr:tunicamycin resistance protein [Chytriomyces hyalinus]TPX74704.1 phospho-N-acetylmuramoyl-pentapeptide-transferase [Chytriomyces confervae]